jgi:hypothetical protein
MKFNPKILFMFFAFASLFVGLLAGLIRLGWAIPITPAAAHHGAIMVGGFLGTLTLLEKAIPLKKKILIVLPVINAFSLVMVIPGCFRIGQISLVIGAVGLLLVLVMYLRKQPGDNSLRLMTMGACCQIVGHLLLVTKQFYPLVFPWWMAFILLVIVGERLELSKFLPVTRVHRSMLFLLIALFLASLMFPFHGLGKYVSGITLAGIAIWLLRYDVIAVAIKKRGFPRYTATVLMAGYISLLFTGVLIVSVPDLPLAYDAIIHTFFLGFAFSMIFAHGPVILPGVLGIGVKPYHNVLYLPIATSMVSLILRLLSDLMVLPPMVRAWSGWISAGCILLYFIILLGITAGQINHAKNR